MGRRFLPILLLITAFSAACAGGYVGRSRGARHDFQDGQYDKALSWYQKQNPPSRDKLLYLLDQGVILHTAGRYQESLQVFQKAIEFIEDKKGPRVASKTASLITNDNMIPYQGEAFEHLLIRVFQILNYIGLGQNREALVEVRYLHNHYESFFREGAKPYLQNAFATYLAGLVWEAEGNLNDAYIDYKTTRRILSDSTLLNKKLSELSYRLGFSPKEASTLSAGEGEVIVLVEEGIVPEKRSTEERQDLQILPVPAYPNILKAPAQVSVMVGGKEVGQGTPLYRVDEAAKELLKDQMPGIIARGLTRLAAKEAGAVVIGKEVDQDLGILFGILILATNRADLRSWLTLPRSFQVVRFPLTEGTHDVTIQWKRKSKMIKDVKVMKRRRTFLIQRLF